MKHSKIILAVHGGIVSLESGISGITVEIHDYDIDREAEDILLDGNGRSYWRYEA